jgi:pimeloyl-ACP methyl ester carboxylesterase
MAPVLPHAQLVVVPDAGHAVHLEQPAAFGETVSAFLAGAVSG